MARHCAGCSHPTICRKHGCAVVEHRRNREAAAIAAIPPDLAARHARAQAEHKAAGGCPGCGSLVLAVHEVGCASVAGDIY